MSSALFSHWGTVCGHERIDGDEVTHEMADSFLDSEWFQSDVGTPYKYQFTRLFATDRKKLP